MSTPKQPTSPYPFKTNTKMILTGTLLEQRIRNICTAVDAMQVAVALSAGHSEFLVNIPSESWTIFKAPISGLFVKIPGLSVLACALHNVVFRPIFIELIQTDSFVDDSLLEVGKADVNLVIYFYYDVVAAQFVVFFEEHYLTMKQDCNFDYTKMNKVWSFGRRIRDAISHGDRVTINDPKFVPVSWYGKEYGHAQNGRVLSSDFTAGDLIVLMCEMERALPRTGA